MQLTYDLELELDLIRWLWLDCHDAYGILLLQPQTLLNQYASACREIRYLFLFLFLCVCWNIKLESIASEKSIFVAVCVVAITVDCAKYMWIEKKERKKPTASRKRLIRFVNTKGIKTYYFTKPASKCISLTYAHNLH